jgi:hypothetical protein
VRSAGSLGRARAIVRARRTARSLPTVTRAEEKKEDKKQAEAKQEAAKETKAAKPRPAPPRSPYVAATPGSGPTANKPIVFSNEDLEARYGRAPAVEPDPGKPSAAGTPDDGKAPADPLESLQRRQQANAKNKQQVAEAEAEVAAARREVARREKQVLAVKNPFAARPELSDEEKATRAQGETGAARLERAEQQLADARKQLEEAQKKLAQARAGSGP